VSENGFVDSTREEAKSLYAALFEKDWPPWIAGLLLAVICTVYVLWRNPWGVIAGYRNWGDWFFYGIGMFSERPLSPLMHNFSLSNIGLLGGALASALLARQWRFNRQPGIEYAKAVVGGVLMGFGSVLAAGCNVGGFYIAIGTFSASGFAMMAGMIIGSYLALRYLLWEIEKFPSRPPAPASAKKNGGFDWVRIQPYIGGAVIIFIVVLFYIYGAMDQTSLGGFLFLGMLIGLVMHRSRFCFVAGFRDFFMTGESRMLRAVALSIVAYALLMAVLKWLYIADEGLGVYNRFWLGGFGGGIIFGIGMVLAGGCGSSTLWRAGEGNTKIWVALVPFCLSMSYFYPLLQNAGWFDKLGSAVFLPAVFSWQWTLPLYGIFFLLWVLIAAWNERTEKLVIF
jgi:uncharacterized protein